MISSRPASAGFYQCGLRHAGDHYGGWKALLVIDNSAPTTDEIRFAIAGNICRCTGYTKIIQAIAETAAHIQQTQQTQGVRP